MLGHIRAALVRLRRGVTAKVGIVLGETSMLCGRGHRGEHVAQHGHRTILVEQEPAVQAKGRLLHAVTLLVHDTAALAPLSHGRAALIGIGPDEAPALCGGKQSRAGRHRHAVADVWVLAGWHVALDVGDMRVECAEEVVVVEAEMLPLHELVESVFRGRSKVLVVHHVAIEAAEAAILRRLRSMTVSLTHGDLNLIVVLSVVGELSLLAAPAVAIAVALATALAVVADPGLVV